MMHRTNCTRTLVLSTLIMLVAACGSSRAQYRFQLQKVSQGDNLTDVSSRISKPLVFENAEFKIVWSPGPLTFYFRIENKAKSDLTINFAKSFLISPAGNAFDAVHPGNGAIAKGDDFLMVPVQVGINSWIRAGQQKGENNSGLAGQIAPGFDGGGFFAETGDVQQLKSEYQGKTAIVVLNIAKAGKAENYRFAIQVADITED